MRLRTSLLLFAAPALLSAQNWYPKNHFSIGGAMARPRGDIGTVLEDAPALTVGYGYRFHRNFQADIGFDTAFGAAGVRDFLDTGFGYRRIRDYQFFVPFGGRAVLPLGPRFEVTGGMGGVFMRYAELLNQPSEYYRFDCPVCTARSGWGYYGLVSASAYLDQRKMFRFGVTGKMYRGNTDGQPLGGIPPVQTTDRWLILGAEFGFSF